MLEGKKPEDIFEEQLNRLNVDYIDFYMLHDVNENSYKIYMNEEYGIIPYLLEQKKAGRIRHFGFSSHAKPSTLKKFLDHYDCFDFVQIQLNYLDWTMQDAKSQYEIITEKGLPIIVMEPCRGGRLASLTPELDEQLLSVCPDKTIASWAFRWLQSLPNVKLVLSGMSSLEQAKNNLETFSELNPLNDQEKQVLDEVVAKFISQINVPCTACHYCDGCPNDLDIPLLLSAYNEFCLSPMMGLKTLFMEIPEEKRPSNCVSCGVCSPKCPQHIDIPNILAKYVSETGAMVGKMSGSASN